MVIILCCSGAPAAEPAMSSTHFPDKTPVRGVSSEVDKASLAAGLRNPTVETGKPLKASVPQELATDAAKLPYRESVPEAAKLDASVERIEMITPKSSVKTQKSQ
jgi:hypothetical protein